MLDIDVQYIVDKGAIKSLADRIDQTAYGSLKTGAEDIISLAKAVIEIATKYKKK